MPDSKSGYLNSPYGRMIVGERGDYYNGHPVDDGKLRGETAPHKVPAHWVMDEPPYRECAQ